MDTALDKISKAITAVKEIYDPNNLTYNLYGVTKFSKATYEKEYEEVTNFFTINSNETFDSFAKIKELLEYYSVKTSNLQTEIESYEKD